jgi:hypothetical protein
MVSSTLRTGVAASDAIRSASLRSSLHATARGRVTGIEAPGVLAVDLDQSALTPLKVLRQQGKLPVEGDQRSTTAHRLLTLHP